MHCLLWQRHGQLLKPEGSTFVSHMRQLHWHGCVFLSLADSYFAHISAFFTGVSGVASVSTLIPLLQHDAIVPFLGCCPPFRASMQFLVGVLGISCDVSMAKKDKKCAAGYVRRTSSRIIPDLNGSGKHLTIGRPIALDEEEYEEYMRSLKNGKQK